MKRAKFPSRPELLSDVPTEQTTDFEPGRDEIFETLIEGERADNDFDPDNNSDDGSLTICGAGHREEEESKESEEEKEIEEEITMPPKSRLPSVKEPSKQPSQCEVSWEALRPVIGYVNVEDPSMRQRRASLTRTGLIIRVDIPGGVNPDSFTPIVSSDGKQVVFTCHLDKSRFATRYVMGELSQEKTLLVGMELALGKSWTYITKRCQSSGEGGEPLEYKQYTLTLPEPCETDFRDPQNEWQLKYAGESGCVLECVDARSMFCYIALFTEKSKDITPARASVKRLTYLGKTYEQNPMSSTNLARDKYVSQKSFYHGRSDTKKMKSENRRNENQSHYRSKSHKSRRSSRRRYSSEFSDSGSEDSDLANTLDAMSICVESKRGSRRRREDSRHHRGNLKDETESQHRERVRGKQRRVLGYLAKEGEAKVDGMTRAQLTVASKEFENGLNELRRGPPGMVTTNKNFSEFVEMDDLDGSEDINSFGDYLQVPLPSSEDSEKDDFQTPLNSPNKATTVVSDSNH